MPAKKETLLIPSGPLGDESRYHLHIICTNPCPAQKQLLISVCSCKEGFRHVDGTCILQKHEHPFLSRESFVLYRAATTKDVREITQEIKSGLYIQKGKINGQTFLKIVRGIDKSPLIPRKFVNYYHANKYR